MIETTKYEFYEKLMKDMKAKCSEFVQVNSPHSSSFFQFVERFPRVNQELISGMNCCMGR